MLQAQIPLRTELKKQEACLGLKPGSSKQPSEGDTFLGHSFVGLQ